MKIGFLGISALTIVVLSGCATQPCTGNPETDSFGCANKALKTGLYESQLYDLQARRMRLEQISSRLTRNDRRLQLEMASVQHEKRQLLLDLKAIDVDLLDLTAQLVELNDRVSITEDTKRKLERRLNALILERGRIEESHEGATSNSISKDDHQILENLRQQIDILRQDTASPSS